MTIYRLTPREKEIVFLSKILGNEKRFITLMLINKGMQPSEIAKEMNISRPAIQKHLESLTSAALLEKNLRIVKNKAEVKYTPTNLVNTLLNSYNSLLNTHPSRKREKRISELTPSLEDLLEKKVSIEIKMEEIIDRLLDGEIEEVHYNKERKRLEKDYIRIKDLINTYNRE